MPVTEVLESAYVATLRGLAVPLRAIGILSRLEHAPRDSLRFWLGSQFAIHDAAKLAELDVPWWTLSAIAKIERWIAARNGDVRAFEYGSGASTLWLARRCTRVVSVEHDAGFAKFAAPMLARSNVRLLLVEPERGVAAPAMGSGRRGYEHCDFSAYVDSIAVEGEYDLIVIDGRARVACLEIARRHLKPGGLVVFDNSNRRRYHAAQANLAARIERCRGLAPALPYPSETALIEFQEPAA